MKTKDTKYIFVTGGVVSSLGKGIIASSLGRLLIRLPMTATRLTSTWGTMSASSISRPPAIATSPQGASTKT